MIKHYNCVVVANGNFPVTPLPLEMLRKASVVIACDGAVEALHHSGFVPHAIVGDFDSIPESMRRLYADRIHVEKDQGTNDLTKAIRFACERGEQEILIVGATGLREDHTLGNISLLADYGKFLRRVEMLTDYGLFTPMYQTTTFESLPGQQISIFSLSPDVRITTERLRWPLKEQALSNWWQGTLNEALESSFTIRMSGSGNLVIYRLLHN